MAQRDPSEFAGVFLHTPRKFGDHRGFFSETYNKRALAALGFEREFVQDNQSLSAEPGVVRGLHFQSPPFAQDKLVRVVRGRILDVGVDIRRGSPTFGDHFAVEISAENWTQVMVPVGFAHGLVTLEPNTEVLYKVTNFYSAEHDHGVLWNDPEIGIAWPIDETAARLSDKDRAQPRLHEIETPFVFGS